VSRDDWKTAGFVALVAITIVAAICAIVEMTFWQAGPFTGAMFLIVVIRSIYTMLSRFIDFLDPRRAKRPPDPP